MKPIIIAALIVVPFVLFIASALVYQSQTGTDIVTGERKESQLTNGEKKKLQKSRALWIIHLQVVIHHILQYALNSAPDLDYEDIRYSNFMVEEDDPHEFDIDDN